MNEYWKHSITFTMFFTCNVESKRNTNNAQKHLIYSNCTSTNASSLTIHQTSGLPALHTTTIPFSCHISRMFHSHEHRGPVGPSPSLPPTQRAESILGNKAKGSFSVSQRIFLTTLRSKEGGKATTRTSDAPATKLSGCFSYAK